MIKLNKKLFLSLAAILILLPSLAHASEIKSGNSVYLSKEETINGNLYTASNSITIDGEIKGDLVAVAQTITINGRLDGDLIAAAQTVTVNGEINGNIRLASNSAHLNGLTARNVNFIGNSLTIGKEAKIGWDLLSGALNTDIMGSVGGSVYGGGDNLILSGQVAKDFNFSGNQSVQTIILTKEAVINGNLYYNENAKINLQDGATVSGQTNIVKNEKNKQPDSNSYIWSLLYRIFAALILGLVLIYVGKNLLLKLHITGQEKILTSFFWGLLAFLVAPAAIILLTFTIIGIPLAIILLISWVLFFWLGKILTAIFLGREILKLFAKNKLKDKNLILALATGVIIAWLLFSIPVIGWILSFVASCFGLGTLIVYLRKQ